MLRVPVTNSKGIFTGKIIRELKQPKNIKLEYYGSIYDAKQTHKILKSINKRTRSNNFNICR